MKINEIKKDLCQNIFKNGGGGGRSEHMLAVIIVRLH
jgi:thiamine pyrophosphokinase